MKKLVFLALLLLNCVHTHTTYIGVLEGTKTYNDPLIVTLVKTDMTKIKVYGRVVPYDKDSTFLYVKDEKEYVKFKNCKKLFLVKDSSGRSAAW